MARKRLYPALPIMLISTFLVLPGCTLTTTSISSSDSLDRALEPAPLQKFQDIPIPAGFVMLPDESYAFQSTNFRAGLLKYRGKATADQMVEFFKEQMSILNWHLINIVEYGVRTLNYEKGEESCIINIDQRGRRSDIVLQIAPKSKKPSASNKPIK